MGTAVANVWLCGYHFKTEVVKGMRDPRTSDVWLFLPPEHQGRSETGATSFYYIVCQ